MPITPSNVLNNLTELRALTANEHGAQRIAWTPTWAAARAWFDARLDALPFAASLDRHQDADHHRAVYSLAGGPATLSQALAAGAREAVARRAPPSAGSSALGTQPSREASHPVNSRAETIEAS